MSEPRCGAVVLDASLPAALRDRLAQAVPQQGEVAFRLLRAPDGLRLRALAAPDLGDLHVDLVGGRTGWRGGARARGERLVRACGVGRGDRPPRLLDGTGGLGTDAWLLACAGAEHVQVVEQHPVLAALLDDARQRAGAVLPEAAARIAVQVGDTRAVLADLAGSDRLPEVLYLDPMYPPRRKSALGDRRLRLVAALLAADARSGDDAAGLVQAGLDAGVRRVVLKRPLHAQVAVATAPSHVHAGRTTRFEVWVRPQQAR